MVRDTTAISMHMESMDIITTATTILAVSRHIRMVQSIPYMNKTLNITDTTWAANPS